jgi:hypothetical protein
LFLGASSAYKLEQKFVGGLKEDDDVDEYNYTNVQLGYHGADAVFFAQKMTSAEAYKKWVELPDCPKGKLPNA